MPNIFIGGTSIGGCNDDPGIMTLDNEGKLDGMIAAVRFLWGFISLVVSFIGG